jgi:dihydropteroate synthase
MAVAGYSDGRPDLDALRREAVRMCPRAPRYWTLAASQRDPARPPVSEQEELDRVVPVVEALRGLRAGGALRRQQHPVVMREAARAGRVCSTTCAPCGREGALDAAVATWVCLCA